ncbi:DNA binding domain-containing protein, excisionase family [Amycolatopsis tolypomycina]|uniref:DNA binding domain-containing protein, excisionase family n=1 Tax=Amycolatopsis tolypomycina TaxID=208445 RepID=A0A1H4QK91_9PSEU|nr:MerR family transcriptional regulator [Amycolatopsis tolypomycina]SEC19989.1 DNA binding domain-containing protein, excisionase family [Amycolatopsis tolypomycina]
MTGDTLGIGELARRTGVPVRTIRFYCDEGVLEPVRSAGGHRRFDSAAIDRLTLVRRLRGLGLGLRPITDVLDGRRSLDDAVAAERTALDRELATLSWRRSVLRAVSEVAPADRAARLELLSAVQDGWSAHETLVRLWRPMTTGPIPPDTARMFLAVSAPEPPAEPSTAQVVAYASLVLLAADTRLATDLAASTLAGHDRIADLGELHAEVGEACASAAVLLAAGAEPAAGPELDRFVAAHATALGATDSVAFRRALNHRTAPDRNPRLRRYWQLTAEVTGAAAPLGLAHTWLLDALDSSVA